MTSQSAPPTFGAWVRARRRQLDLTQAGLGRRAGCSEAAIRKIEANERKPSLQLAELLCRALEIPAAEQEMFLKFGRGMLPEALQNAPRYHPNNLPVLLTSTVDRIHDLAAISELLVEKAVHLVRLVGPPGIGKTRLSIHAGEKLLFRFPDGVWFVDLAETSNPDFFLSTLVRSLPGLNLPPLPDLDQFLRELRERHLLLILDNFEQIAEKASLYVASILKACPKVQVLVTSRVPLHIYGEYEYALPALSIPPRQENSDPERLMQFEAVQLFVARVRQHTSQFKVSSENAGAVIEICTMLDGIPLALELAAATLRRMTLSDMTAMLKGLHGPGWIRQISTSARDVPLRQQTLENVIDWSYTLLDDVQKAYFNKLGVLSGWFDAEVAAAICETPPSQAIEILNSLADHSLLQREIFNDNTYWRMLELIHEYAGLRLDPEGRSHVERLRAEYFSNDLQRLGQTENDRTGREAYCRIHIKNLLAVLRWAVRENQVELGFQFMLFLEQPSAALGFMREVFELARMLAALPDTSEPQVRADRLEQISDMAWQLHDFETALLYSRQALDLGRAHGLKQSYPWYLNRLGRIHIEQEKYAQARVFLEECLAIAYGNALIINPGWPLAQLGEVALFEGRLEDAKLLLQDALTHLDAWDDIFRAMAETDLAEIALAQKNYAEARIWLVKVREPASHHVRRWLVFLGALAGYLMESGRNKTEIHRAVQLYGAIETFSTRAGINFNSFYQKLKQKRMQTAQEKLSQKEYRAAHAKGREWSREDLLAWTAAELSNRG